MSTFAIAAIVSESATSVVPARGGELTEGIVGTPRFVNPLLAASDADRDLTMLVYSGLMRARPDNTLVPDLADHYEVSDDHLTYTFTIREDATFHDGTPVSAHDVVYTVTTAQNPLYKSVRRVDWDGVVAQEIDTHTVRFTLPRLSELRLTSNKPA
jgi:peptide/nickel transport system substrate-binding protein